MGKDLVNNRKKQFYRMYDETLECLVRICEKKWDNQH